DNSSYIPMFNLSNEKSGVDISYKVIRNNEYDEILVDLGTLSNVEYAIYFINNKSEKNVTWYQSSPIFKVPKGNIVKVHIFVRDIFKNVIHKLLPYQISENALLDTVSLRNRSFSLFTYIIGGDFKKLKDNGWKPREDIDLISINYPIHWDHSDDNTAFNLHAWRFMSSSWASYSQDPSFKNTKEIVDFNINIVNDWFVNHGRFNSKFSWYDMAVAFRAFHLSFLKFIITNYKLELSVHLSKMIDDLIDQHIIWLSNKDNIGYGNHALYQFISLKTLEFVLGRNDNDEFCYNAMRNFIEYSFDENSINNENSPFYHEYNLQILKNINSDIFPELKNEIDKIICKGTLVTKWLT
ncbi:hypothetical protein, partial [Acinetobacter proteolyticus]|uniref:hypothetical protein n=1 Tax=Acinetobacter proteolyticus TaxID=1776741 RepID=UPI001356DD08